MQPPTGIYGELTFEHTYRGMPILPESVHGNYVDILETLYGQLADMTARHSKVFCVLFTLGFPSSGGYPPDNSVMQRFIDSFRTYLNRAGLDLRYCWVREQTEPNHQQHYHVSIFIDGDRTRSFYGRHQAEAEKFWGLALGIPSARGLVHLHEWTEQTDYTGNGGVMIRRPPVDQRGDWRQESVCAFFQRVSYLAKAATKTYAPMSTRRFAASQVRSRV